MLELKKKHTLDEFSIKVFVKLFEKFVFIKYSNIFYY